MRREVTRRVFIQASATGGLAGLAAGASLSPAPATGQVPSAELIPVDPDIEQLVKLIYATPAERIVGVMVDQVRRGLSYRRFLAANFIAAIRYHLGAHTIFVSHPVNQVALDASPQERLLPLFYHAAILRSQSWKPQMKRIEERDLPPARRAATLFAASMETGDKPVASAALLALARSEGPRQAFERLWFYGAERNHDSGGHTAIAVSNTFRVLETIGWHHAEPVLQYLVEKECCRPPGGSDLHHVNAERTKGAHDLPQEWTGQRSDRQVVLELLTLYRQGNPDEACRATHELLRQGRVQAGSVWDAIFLLTAELMIRYKWCGPSMLAGHAVTCTNALHYAFRTVLDPGLRLFTLLEAVEWSTSFLRKELDEGTLRDLKITEIPQVESPASIHDAADEIFAMLPPRRFFEFSRSPRADQDRAMVLTYALARKNVDRRLFFCQARRLLCLKSTQEVHDFKYPIALFEHYHHASAEWRPNLLAASAHYLHGTKMEDSPAVAEARQALTIHDGTQAD